MASQVIAYPAPPRNRHADDHQAADKLRQNRRILVLTAQIGAGHISTAAALKEQLEREDVTAEVTLDEPITRIRALSRLPQIYRFMITYLPPIWALFYYGRKIKFVRTLYGMLIRRRLHPSISQLALHDYDTVVITYSMYCNCIATFTDAGLHTVVLVTDLFGGPHEWFLPGAHKYIVPTKHMESMGKSCGIADSRLLRRRLPTVVSRLPPQATWTANEYVELRILVVGGSEGLGPLEDVAIDLLRSSRPMSITVGCGDNERLRKRLQSKHRDLTVKGFVPSLASTYADYDLVVTKPGSVTLMELLHQNVPFILLPGILGIEAGNTSLFRRLHLPRIRGFTKAQFILRDLINEDLSLSARGIVWTSALRAIHEALPADSITLAELSPEYRRSGTSHLRSAA
jgi:processive 1,2-diacylglycerol beta-glucosyltransferase